MTPSAGSASARVGIFERIERSRVLPKLDDRPVWAIVCFVVSRSARGEGLSAALLDAAVSWARDNGAATLEAYPVDVDARGPIPASALYTGMLSTFLKAGFAVASDTGSSSGGRPRKLVRLELRRRRAAGRAVAKRPAPVRHPSR